jgi:hypothetical protein
MPAAAESEWLVWFDARSALIVQAATADVARFVACLQAWSLTGKWLTPLRVERGATEEAAPTEISLR